MRLSTYPLTEALMPHLSIAPIVLPLLAACMMLFLGEHRLRTKTAVSLFATLLNLVLAVLLFQWTARGDAQGTYSVYLPSNWDVPFGIVLVLDRLSALMLLLVGIVGMMALLFAVARWHKAGAHFHPLFQIQLMGLNGAFLTGDLFNLFVFFEVMLAASYGLLLHGSGWQRVQGRTALPRVSTWWPHRCSWSARPCSTAWWAPSTWPTWRPRSRRSPPSIGRCCTRVAPSWRGLPDQGGDVAAQLLAGAGLLPAPAPLGGHLRLAHQGGRLCACCACPHCVLAAGGRVGRFWQRLAGVGRHGHAGLRCPGHAGLAAAGAAGGLCGHRVLGHLDGHDRPGSPRGHGRRAVLPAHLHACPLPRSSC
jgi:hypothetical protein